MKRIILFSIFFLLYILSSYIYSLYNYYETGFYIGYPMFYYQFYTDSTEKQWGTTPLNFLLNILIVLIIYWVVQKIIKLLKK